AWNRPIFNAGGAAYPNQSSDPRMVNLGAQSWITLDNIEFTGYYANGAGAPITTDYVDFGGGNPGIVVENCYFHGWVNPYWSVGTGNTVAGSSTVTNFIPYSWSPSPSSSWPSVGIGYGGLPEQNGGPLTLSISASSPYTITTNACTTTGCSGTGTAVTTCTGCTIEIGQDYLVIAGGVNTQCSGCMMVGNVIDGSDTAQVAVNPYADCGLTESNNQWCVASGTAGFHLPNIWRGNVIRYVQNGLVGECTEYSNNLTEYMRPSLNPTSHQNMIECLTSVGVNGYEAFYNNVFEHFTVQNPSIPGIGYWTIGVGYWWGPNGNDTLIAFNNVGFDTLQNGLIERIGTTGTYQSFNNSGDCGPAWNLTYQCAAGMVTADKIQNNYYVTSNGIPFGVNGSSTPTESNNLIPSSNPGTMNGPGAVFAYSPISNSSPTVGAGINLSLY